MPRIWIVAFLSGTALVHATQMCESCIPLEELISTNYGIDFASDGIVYASASHSRATITRGRLPSPESAIYNGTLTNYVNLMNLYEKESNGSSLRFLGEAWYDFGGWSRREALSLIRQPGNSFFDGIESPRKKMLPSPEQWPDIYNLSDDARIIVEALEATNIIYPRWPLKTAFRIPMWMTANQTIPFFQALHYFRHQVVDIGWSPMAVAGVARLDLCRISSEYIPCNRKTVTTIGLTSRGLTLETMVFGACPNDEHWQASAPRLGRNISSHRHESEWESETTKFLNGYAMTTPQNATHVFLTGAGAKDASLIAAVQDSELASAWMNLTSEILPEDVEASGMALVAKDLLEWHGTDCIEPVECEDIREEADQIAGSPYGDPSEEMEMEDQDFLHLEL